MRKRFHAILGWRKRTRKFNGAHLAVQPAAGKNDAENMLIIVYNKNKNE